MFRTSVRVAGETARLERKWRPTWSAYVGETAAIRLVHGVAAGTADYEVMRNHDVTLVWSPRSNLTLYGETVDISVAMASGVRIALATDWSPSGSFNMREEVRCAREVARSVDMRLAAHDLWQMVTVTAPTHSAGNSVRRYRARTSG